jgi:hypothetical protein
LRRFARRASLTNFSMAQKQIAPTTQIIKIPIKTESIVISLEDGVVTDAVVGLIVAASDHRQASPTGPTSSDQSQQLRAMRIRAILASHLGISDALRRRAEFGKRKQVSGINRPTYVRSAMFCS